MVLLKIAVGDGFVLESRFADNLSEGFVCTELRGRAMYDDDSFAMRSIDSGDNSAKAGSPLLLDVAPVYSECDSDDVPRG